MPAFYTHYLVARQALSRLSPKIQAAAGYELPLYLFGAQGADFCFFYPTLRPKTQNLGAYLHREGGFPAFQTLKALSREPATLAYAMGYIAHYAADRTFHPYVYATAGNSPLRHSRLENLLDLHFQGRFPLDGRERPRLDAAEKETLFFIYTALAAKSGLPAPKRSAFLRSIFLFNAYLPLSNTLSVGASEKILAIAANAEKRTWAYPAKPELIRDDDGDELFERAVALTAELQAAFYFAVKERRPLPKPLFDKGFLTGV